MAKRWSKISLSKIAVLVLGSLTIGAPTASGAERMGGSKTIPRVKDDRTVFRHEQEWIRACKQGRQIASGGRDSVVEHPFPLRHL